MWYITDMNQSNEEKVIAKAQEILNRLEADAATRGLPVGNGPIATMARLLIKQAQARIAASNRD